MIARTDLSIKPYRPELPLRERARQAFDAEQATYAKERAAALARAQDRLAESLIVTCERVLGVTIDRPEILTTICNDQRTVAASAIVESILLTVRMAAADAAKLSGPIAMGTLRAEPHCPVCGVALSLESSVFTVAELGRLLGELGCGSCGWMPAEQAGY